MKAVIAILCLAFAANYVAADLDALIADVEAVWADIYTHDEDGCHIDTKEYLGQYSVTAFLSIDYHDAEFEVSDTGRASFSSMKWHYEDGLVATAYESGANEDTNMWFGFELDSFADYYEIDLPTWPTYYREVNRLSWVFPEDWFSAPIHFSVKADKAAQIGTKAEQEHYHEDAELIGDVTSLRVDVTAEASLGDVVEGGIFYKFATSKSESVNPFGIDWLPHLGTKVTASVHGTRNAKCAARQFGCKFSAHVEAHCPVAGDLDATVSGQMGVGRLTWNAEIGSDKYQLRVVPHSKDGKYSKFNSNYYFVKFLVGMPNGERINVVQLPLSKLAFDNIAIEADKWWEPVRIWWREFIGKTQSFDDSEHFEIEGESYSIFDMHAIYYIAYLDLLEAFEGWHEHMFCNTVLDALKLGVNIELLGAYVPEGKTPYKGSVWMVNGCHALVQAKVDRNHEHVEEFLSKVEGARRLVNVITGEKGAQAYATIFES